MAPAFYLKGCMLSFQTLGPYLGDKRVLLDIWVYLSLGVSRDITGCGAECGKPHTAYPSVTIFFLSFFFFLVFRAAPAAYGSSQARGWIRGTAAGLHHSHSNTGSKPHLRPTPQLTATPDP